MLCRALEETFLCRRLFFYDEWWVSLAIMQRKGRSFARKRKRHILAENMNLSRCVLGTRVPRNGLKHKSGVDRGGSSRKLQH